MIPRAIRCDWGDRIVDAHDTSLCRKQATQRVALHLSPDDAEGTPFQFCPEHLEHVLDNTDTRTGPIVER